jgi:hypothetical protein
MGLGVRARGSPGRLLHRVPGGVAITKVMSDITIHELEAAINFWRARSPSSGDELVLCKEASALSKPYALMIVQRRNALPPEGLDETAREAWNSYVRLKNGL